MLGGRWQAHGIPLIMNDSNSPLPTLDSTRLLARAALRRALRFCTRTAVT